MLGFGPELWTGSAVLYGFPSDTGLFRTESDPGLCSESVQNTAIVQLLCISFPSEICVFVTGSDLNYTN
jgi:hypothetical protein